MPEKMSAARVLDYIDARQMAKAMARWRVAGDLSDEQLQEDSVSCRYLNRRIAELTEDYVPYAVAAIKALGAEPVDVDTLQREADGMREALLAAHHAIVSLDEDVFGPILDGHGGHCGWVRDELLSNLRAALNGPPQDDGDKGSDR